MSLFTCKYCGQERPAAGARSVTGVGRCCAGCVEEMRQAKPLKPKAEAKSIAAWPSRKPLKAPAPAAEPAAGPKVTVLPGWTHDPRYQLPPGERVQGGFATAGIGRYIEGAAA